MGQRPVLISRLPVAPVFQGYSSFVMKPFKGWRYLFAFVFLVLLSLLINEWVAVSAPAAGFVLPEAEVVILSADFGAFWRLAESTHTFALIRKEVPLPLKDWELRARLSVGMRPTPERWRLWLGRNLVYSVSPKGTTFSFYPGAFLRMLDWGRRVFVSDMNENGGFHVFGDYVYAWRNGFLLVSLSREALAELLKGECLSRDIFADKDTIEIRSLIEPRFRIKVSAKNGFPIEGMVNVNMQRAGDGLVFSETFEKEAIVSISSSTPANLKVLGDTCEKLFCRNETMKELFASARFVYDRWGLGGLAQDWDAGILETSVTLFSVKTYGSFPVPELFGVFRYAKPVFGEHPLSGLVKPLFCVPVEWEDQPGLIAPLLGDEFAINLGRIDRYWCFSTNQKSMARYLGSFEKGEPIDADLSVTVNYGRVVEPLRDVLNVWSEFEPFPKSSGREMVAEYEPWLSAIGNLGAFRLQGKITDEGLFLKGFLSQPVGN